LAHLKNLNSAFFIDTFLSKTLLFKKMLDFKSYSLSSPVAGMSVFLFSFLAGVADDGRSIVENQNN